MQSWTVRGTLGTVQTITVPEGSSVASIATQLKDAGVIKYDWLFKQYVKYSGKADAIQYGNFEVQSGMAYNDIIKALSVVTRRPTVNVTIPEGTTAVGVAQIFCGRGPCGRCGHLRLAVPTAPMARTSASMISGTPSPTMTA